MKFLLAILFAAVLLLGVSTSYSFAQEESTSTDSAEVAETDEKSTYILVYPGMLPDNPLYFLKALRDSFIGLIISDPLKKAEFDLLQADKHVASGVFLVRQSKNQDRALETIKKAHVFYEDALVKTQAVDKKEQELKGYIERLASAGEKHSEVLMELSAETKNKEFSSLAQKSEDLSQKAEALIEGK